jgi:hypothetical protein
VGQLARHLLPAGPDLPKHQFVGDEDAVEDDLVEDVLVGDEPYRLHRYPRRREVHDELTQAGVPVFFAVGRGAAEHDKEVGEVGAAGPDLRAIDEPSTVNSLRACLDGGEIRAALGLAHADGEEALTAGDSWQEARLLLFGAEAQDTRAALAVGDPVRSHRCPRCEQLFQDHEPLQRGPLMPPVPLGPRHPQPTALAELMAEVRRVPIEPPVAPRLERAGGELLREEGAYLGAQVFDPLR